MNNSSNKARNIVINQVPGSLPLTLLFWMFCRCFTVISKISAFSSLDCCRERRNLSYYRALAVCSEETREDNTHVQPERSDHSFFELIQTVVYPLPPLSLNERLSEL